MNSSQPEKRVDPLIDAYRQASALDAQTSRAGPIAATRAAVLAHARVVAQSVTTAEPKLAVSEAVRATPAANEPKPVWRMVAGVVLGLAGMWAYQLTRPGTTGEANVAVLSAPQSAKAGAGTGTGVGAAATAASPAVAPATPAVAPATPVRPQPETTVAVVAPVAPVPSGSLAAPAATAAAGAPGMRTAPLRERSDSSAPSGGAASDIVADSARREQSIAQARVASPLKQAEPAAQIAAPANAGAAATSTTPETAASEPLGEAPVAVAVASADTSKRARAPSAPAAVAAPVASAATPVAPVAAAPVMAAAPPNAFPATSAGVIAQSAPRSNAPDTAMFSAIRLGNVGALRAAIARGANVNARDEAGRSALQIARERNDVEMMKALDLAGAKLP